MNVNDIEGKTIKLVRMEDPYTNLKKGDTGIGKGIDAMGNILVEWENGSNLSLIPEIDEFEIFESFGKKYSKYLYVEKSMEQLYDLFSGYIGYSFTYEVENEGNSCLLEMTVLHNQDLITHYECDFTNNVLNILVEKGEDRKEELNMSSTEEILDYIEKSCYSTLKLSEMKVFKFNDFILERYGYPSLEEVESADHRQICYWYRHLPSPGKNIPESLDEKEFKDEIDDQTNILNLISKKYKDGGGMSPEISKSIGW